LQHPQGRKVPTPRQKAEQSVHITVSFNKNALYNKTHYPQKKKTEYKIQPQETGNLLLVFDSLLLTPQWQNLKKSLNVKQKGI